MCGQTTDLNLNPYKRALAKSQSRTCQTYSYSMARHEFSKALWLAKEYIEEERTMSNRSPNPDRPQACTASRPLDWCKGQPWLPKKLCRGTQCIPCFESSITTLQLVLPM